MFFRLSSNHGSTEVENKLLIILEQMNGILTDIYLDT